MKFGVIAVAAILAGIAVVFLGTTGSSASKNMPVNSFYEIDVTDIDGNTVNLGRYKNNVVMFVNTASKCGYTPQYKGLQEVYDKYKDRGFVILGFPANNFGGQEPGSNEEIKEFCELKYKVTFPMFAKISVAGDDQHLLYKYLTDQASNPKFSGDIPWNFTKFLAGHDGGMVARFSSKETPESEAIATAIEEALDARDKALASDDK